MVAPTLTLFPQEQAKAGPTPTAVQPAPTAVWDPSQSYQPCLLDPRPSGTVSAGRWGTSTPLLPGLQHWTGPLVVAVLVLLGEARALAGCLGRRWQGGVLSPPPLCCRTSRFPPCWPGPSCCVTCPPVTWGVLGRRRTTWTPCSSGAGMGRRRTLARWCPVSLLPWWPPVTRPVTRTLTVGRGRARGRHSRPPTPTPCPLLQQGVPAHGVLVVALEVAVALAVVLGQVRGTVHQPSSVVV